MSERADPRAHATSVRWVVATLIVVAAVSAASYAMVRAEHAAYEAGWAAAVPGTSATVTDTTVHRKGPDDITVRWWDAGAYREHTFRVSNASTFAVGTEIELRVSPTDSAEVYPADRDLIDETTLGEVGLVLLLIGVATAGTAWGWRGWRWWRCSRAPAQRLRARLRFSYGRAGAFGTPFIVLSDGRFQRMMWEPWVLTAASHDRLAVDLRISGRSAVVDVMSFGRLYPAGPLRTRALRFEFLEPLRPSSRRPSRVPMVVVAGVAAAVLALVYQSVGALAIGAYLWLLILYVGGPPVGVPFSERSDARA